MNPDRFRLRNHFTVLIYPFLHGISAANRSQRLAGLAAIWQPWWTRLDEAQAATALDDTYFFLPYIRDVLYPETAALNCSADAPASAAWWTHILRWQADDGWRTWEQALPPDAILHLTYRPEALDPLRVVQVASHAPGAATTIDLLLDWIDAVLFPSGIGFLLLKVHLAEAGATLNRLIDLNYYARLVHPPRTGWMLPALRWEKDEPPWTMRDFIDFLLQDMVNGAEAPIRSRTAFLEQLERVGAKRYTQSDPGQVYGERCQIVSYACIDMAEARRQDRATGAFATPEDRLLFEYASCIPLGDSVRKPMWVPSPEEAETLTHYNRFALWRCWRGMALKESVVFLATEDLPFTTGSLAHNIESDYLPLYLFALHQRYQLFLFSNDLMRKGAYADRNLRDVRALTERFFQFRNRFWFSEVTRKPQGGTLYRAFQYGLDVRALYDLVCEEIKDLDAFYEHRHAQRINRLVNLFTFVFVPLGLVTGIFGMTFLDTGSWTWFLLTCGGVTPVSLFVWWRTRR